MFRKNWFAFAFGLVLCLFFFEHCQTAGTPVRLAEEPFEKLSEYHFFTGEIKKLQPNDRVLPYDLNAPLFSDYAEKSRFVWMPAGVSAQYSGQEAFSFPEGAVLIKNFFYPHDQRAPEKGRRIMETRLLIRRAKDWQAMTYIWNEAQTEAFYSIVGDITPVSWMDKSGHQIEIDYVIPNRNQCKGCHAYEEAFIPIGPKARNLNKIFAYAGGPANQLAKWAEMGYLDGYDPALPHPVAAQWDQAAGGTLHERALAYLDINCGHCHNPHGPANTSGLNLTAHEQLNLNLGLWKAPVSAGKGSGGLDYSIVPGQPDQSILVYRMESTDPGAMMPEVGRVMVHTEGVALIKEWIREMDADLLSQPK